MQTYTPRACVCVCAQGKDTDTHTQKHFSITGRMALGVGGTAEAVTVLVNAIGSFALRGGTENKTHFLYGRPTDSSSTGKKEKKKDDRRKRARRSFGERRKAAFLDAKRMIKEV